MFIQTEHSRSVAGPVKITAFKKRAPGALCQGAAPVRARPLGGQLVEDRPIGGQPQGTKHDLQQLSSAARAQHAAGGGAHARGTEAQDERENQGIHGGQLFRLLSQPHQRLHP